MGAQLVLAEQEELQGEERGEGTRGRRCGLSRGLEVWECVVSLGSSLWPGGAGAWGV